MKAEQIDRLAELISNREWHNFDQLAHPTLTTRDAVVSMLKVLPENEINLTLDLLEDYQIIKEYNRHARELMSRIRKLYDGREVVITPLRDYESQRTKSGQALHYEMNNFKAIFKPGSVIFRDDPKSNECQTDGIMHVCVDDYIGTGSQFFTMLENIKDDGKDNTISIVVAVCIQEQAKKRLESEGYHVEAIEIKGKGLERLAARKDVPLANVYAEYDRLEKKTHCPDAYRRGKGASEALVTMKSTPNNTLPIFWFEGRKNWPAPFPRPRR